MKRTKEQLLIEIARCEQALKDSVYNELNPTQHFWYNVCFNKNGSMSMYADHHSHKWSKDKTYIFTDLSIEEIGQLLGGN